MSFQKKTGGESWLTFLSLGFLPDWYVRNMSKSVDTKEVEWI